MINYDELAERLLKNKTKKWIGIVGGPGVLRGSTECWLSQSNLFTANTTNTTSHLNWMNAFSSLNSKLLLAFLEKGFDYI